MRVADARAQNRIRAATVLVAMSFVAVPSVPRAQVTPEGRDSLALTGGNTFLITEDLGLLRGPNLFHSFSSFNLGAGEVGRFTGPSTISNILARVVGGSLSTIDGTIHTLDYPNANLLLMNGHGFVFGENAVLRVDGAFHATTADYIRLADGVRFDSDVPLDPDGPLSEAPPVAFGFLGDNPASISVMRSTLAVEPGETLALVGGDILVMDGATLSAPGGRIDIASVRSVGEVVPSAAGVPADLRLVGVERGGEVRITDSDVNAGGNGGGTVIIRGGRLVMEAGFMGASALGNLGAGGTPSAGIDIEVHGEAVFDRAAAVGTNVFPAVSNDSGGIRVTADQIDVMNGSHLDSVVFFGSLGGDSGDIALTADTVRVRNGGFVRANTLGAGKAGNIAVRAAERLEMMDGGLVFSLAFFGSGDSGSISIDAGHVSVSNLNAPGFLNLITTQSSTDSTGRAGDIVLDTDSLVIEGSLSAISSPTFGTGAGGNVDITVAREAIIRGSPAFPNDTGAFTNTFGTGAAGDLRFTAGSLQVENSGSLQTSTFSSGPGGNLIVSAGRTSLTGSARFSAIANDAGAAGNLTVSVSELVLANRSNLATLTQGLGPAGDMTIVADHLTLSGGSFVTSATAGAGGGGTIDITTSTLTASGFASSSNPFGADATGITAFSGAGGGAGGDIRIATGSLQLSNRATINASSLGPGTGGSVAVDAGTVRIVSGASITASAFDSGAGGNVVLRSEDVLLSGVHPEPFRSEISDSMEIAVSGVASQTATSGGNAGSVRIDAGVLQVVDGALVATNSFGPGNAGGIDVSASQVRISGFSETQQAFLTGQGFSVQRAELLSRSGVVAGTTSRSAVDTPSGNAGLVRIAAEDLLVANRGLLSSRNEGSGAGGNVEIAAASVTVSDDALISAESTASGPAGSIAIRTRTLAVSGGGRITAGTSGSGAGGNVDIAALNDVVIEGSSSRTGDPSALSTQSSSSLDDAGIAGDIRVAASNVTLRDRGQISTLSNTADGGNVKLDVDFTVLLDGAQITTSVGAGRGSGGNIDIDPVFVILFASRVEANAFGGPGGNIRIVTDNFFADSRSVLEASSAQSIDGTVEIVSPDTDISATLAVLQSEYVDPATQLAAQCSARRGRIRASFVREGRGGLPASPAAPLMSYFSVNPAPGATAGVADSGSESRRLARTSRWVPWPMKLECDAPASDTG